MKKIVLLLALAFFGLMLNSHSAEAGRTAREDIQRMLDMHDQAMMYVDKRNPYTRGLVKSVGCKLNVFDDHCNLSAEVLASEVEYENKVWPLGAGGGPRITVEWGQWFDMLKAAHPEMTADEEKWAWDNWARIRSEQWNTGDNNLIVLRRDAVLFDPPPGQGGVGENGGPKTPDATNNGGGGMFGGVGGGSGGDGKASPSGANVGAIWKSRGVQDLGDENNPDDPASKVKKLADDAAKKKGAGSSYIPDDSYRLDGVNKYGKNREEQ